MRIFLTGATGFIGSAVVEELIGSGYKVLGLVRSDEKAKSLKAAGAEVHRGSLDDLESLRSGAAAADAVIHTAFIHDFSKFQESCDVDRRAIEALGSVLEGSDRPLIVTSGLATVAEGRSATEKDAPRPPSPALPRVSEITAEKLLARGVRASTVRLPQVHNPVKAGLVTHAINLAREKGVSAYVGDGMNRWAAVHLLDAARLYRLVLEKGVPGGRYHAVAEEGVPYGEIAQAIGRRARVPVVSKSPEEAEAHFGWRAFFISRDIAGSSALTQKELGWWPAGPSLITDLDAAQEFEPQPAYAAR
jgi:nucleoside-diphosphate-sugar epimerase